MTASSLQAALRAGAQGLYVLEAATGLNIAHGTWLDREDFVCFVHCGTGTAAIDWEAVISALEGGGLPSSAGECRMLASRPASPTTSRSASARPSPASIRSLKPTPL